MVSSTENTLDSDLHPSYYFLTLILLKDLQIIYYQSTKFKFFITSQYINPCINSKLAVIQSIKQCISVAYSVMATNQISDLLGADCCFIGVFLRNARRLSNYIKCILKISIYNIKISGEDRQWPQI